MGDSNAGIGGLADEDTPRIPTLQFDLPGDARRLLQRAHGLLVTLVRGRVLLRSREHRGALPGRLVRERTAGSA